ncbi:MAG TPA: BREX system P-loop protein BrxC [Actinomycetota bacterium]|nr:BREX system P-loop protein BrxC [Actinomycetota bacterium]
MKIRDTIERDLGNEPQSVVKVYETARLRTDFTEYVLTDTLAREFAKVLEPLVESARPATTGTGKVGIWISGFFGSGKSHFAKIAGHLAADTAIGGETARSLFGRLLRPGSPPDDRLAELLQEATNYQLQAILVPFDIATVFSPADATNVGRTFLRMLYETVGFSSVIPFAERELELKKAGLYDEFTALYRKKSGVPWAEEKNLAASSPTLAECLADLLPDRYSSAELALASLKFELDFLASMSIKDVVNRLVRWLDGTQAERKRPQRLLFVADEVGAWAGRNLDRIEQMRALVEELSVVAQGRIWLMVTSQERLSDVVANAPLQDPRAARDLQHRLEARFRVNVHLESSEVGTVIENRILTKKPAAWPALEKLWRDHEAKLADIADSPGIELGGNYPGPELERFIKDYPFLPYQIPAAADLFGGMRGPKVSSGARSMIKIVFDAVQRLADEDLGRLARWDQIFDSANRDNEFADEQYLGSQGLNYLTSADRDVAGTSIQPSRVLKALWLMQQSPRIPRTTANLARLLVDHLHDGDVVEIERDVKETLRALEKRSFVRLEAATDQWRFLTQDQVTIERIVQRIAEEDVKGKDVREETHRLYSDRLLALFNGRITHGRSNTVFEYGAYVGDTPLKNDDAPVKLKLCLAGSPQAEAAQQASATDLDAPLVYWVVDVPGKLDERLRRAIAIERLAGDEEFRRVATERTKREAKDLEAEADELRRAAADEVGRVLERGTVYWGGQVTHLDGAAVRAKKAVQVSAKTEIERALHDQLNGEYHRFEDGDLEFNAINIDKLFQAAPADRKNLDPHLRFFDLDGHVIADHAVLEAIMKDLGKTTKNAGRDLVDRFHQPPFGWQADLIRYGTAALFIEGRLSVLDPAGRRHDDPRTPAARSLFGTAQFKTARFDVEENPLIPQERADARTLLADLGAQPAADDEITLKETTLRAIGDLGLKLAAIDKAREVGLPLPPVYDAMSPILEDLRGEASKAKLIRSLLGHGQELREGKKALDRLESFNKHNGPAQYRRSQELLQAAIHAGLVEDPTWGATIRDILEQYEALKEQRRILDEWDTVIKEYRAKVVEAYRAVYVPLRQDVAQRVAEARDAITSMPEFDQLRTADRAQIRAELLAEGRPLAEVSVPKLHDEEQLLSATRGLSIPHLRSMLAALDAHVAKAKARVLQLYTASREEKEPPIIVWDPLPAFSGAQFAQDEDVDMVFDTVKEEVKALIREGKIVRVL